MTPLIMVRSRRRALYLIRLRVQATRTRVGVSGFGLDESVHQ